MDRVMMMLTGRWTWIPLYAALYWLLTRRFGWRNACGYALVIAAIIAMSDQMCASLIRPLVERLRPSNLLNPLSEFTRIVGAYRGGSYGFPSCHAANTIALATYFAVLVRSRWLTATLFVWAALNCYTRIYLGVHYPGDILVGGLVGAGIALLFNAAVRYYVSPRLIPGDKDTAWPCAVFAGTVLTVLAIGAFVQ